MKGFAPFGLMRRYMVWTTKGVQTGVAAGVSFGRGFLRGSIDLARAFGFWVLGLGFRVGPCIVGLSEIHWSPTSRKALGVASQVPANP